MIPKRHTLEPEEPIVIGPAMKRRSFVKRGMQMIYKRKVQATDTTSMSAEEQAKEMREVATKHAAVLLKDQKEQVVDKLLKQIESGEVDRIIVLDKEHGDPRLEEKKRFSPDFEITMP